MQRFNGFLFTFYIVESISLAHFSFIFIQCDIEQSGRLKRSEIVAMAELTSPPPPPAAASANPDLFLSFM